MSIFTYILFGILIVCAVSVTFSKNLLNSVLIFMAFSLVMSIIWMLLESPDLAITEAAVGAGVTSVLFFATLKKIHGMLNNPEDENSDVLEDEDDMDENRVYNDESVNKAEDDNDVDESNVKGGVE